MIAPKDTPRVVHRVDGSIAGVGGKSLLEIVSADPRTQSPNPQGHPLVERAGDCLRKQVCSATAGLVDRLLVPAGTVLHRSTSGWGESFQVRGRGVHESGLAFEHLRRARDPGIGFRVVPLLDALAHAGQCLDVVPGVETRRVQQVAIPLPMREAGRVQQLPLSSSPP